MLFDATQQNGKSLKTWCKANRTKCRSEEPKFEHSATGIIELLVPGGGHDKGCVYKKEKAHDAFSKSIKRQGSNVNIEFSSVI